jgi:5-hydroxyisourate hydrolase-like protein (transthyretin family)
LKTDSKFTEIFVDPEEPIYGQTFNITSVLGTEFGKVFPGENVTLQYFKNDLWENISTQITNTNGTTNFEIDTILLLSKDSYTFRLNWQGDEYTLGNSQNITVLMFRAINNLSLLITKDVDRFSKNAQSTIKVTLNNLGDSELNVLIPNITIKITPSLTYSIVQIDYIALAEFKPGDNTEILIKINVPNIEQINFSISIIARNELTNEEVKFKKSKIYRVYDAILDDLIMGFFTFIMIGIFMIVWAAIFIYARRTIKKIETPFEEPVKTRPRKGKYVSVSELPSEVTEEKKEEIPTEKKKKLSKKKSKKQKVEEKEKSTTDLDSLLEEKGLKD